MEENYYDILQVNKNASKEIIEKAYKTLVKKYHPDLQENNIKIEYEEKIKKINEAYEVLSNSEKRKSYDLTLKQSEISINDYNSLYQENIKLKNNLNFLKQKLNNVNYNNNNYNTVNSYYQNDYIQTSKKQLYQFKYKTMFKNLISLFITILVIIIIIYILWHIPFTKNYFIKLYENNEILQLFVDLILNIFK